MKKFIITIFSFILIFNSRIYAQTPEALNYQAVARNASGGLLVNQPVGVRLSIIQGSSSGTVIYEETQASTTNQFGLFTLAIGTGTPVTGTFNTIPWSTGQFWLKIELDPAGGTSYVTMGTSQLLAVPFAMYAANAGNSSGIGSTNHLGRWINGTTLGTGVVQDDSISIGIHALPNSNYRLFSDGGGTMTGTYGQYDANRYGCLGGTAYGVYGYVNNNGGNTFKAGVYGYNQGSGVGTGFGLSQILAGTIGNNNDGYAYHFGLAGYCQNNQVSYPYGGVIGSATITNNPTIWGALGYKISATREYAGYFMGNTYVHSTGNAPFIISGATTAFDPTDTVIENSGGLLMRSSLIAGNISQADIVAIGSDNGNYTSSLSFWTRPSAGNPTNRMIINKDGYIGIGTINPVYFFTVMASAALRHTGYFSNSYACGSMAVSGTPMTSSSAAIIGDYTNTGANDGIGVYGSAIGTSSGHGYGGFFEGKLVGVVGRSTAGGTTGVYAYSNGAANALYVNGNLAGTGTNSYSSDAKLKHDIRTIDGALDKILKMKPSVYEFRVGEFGSMELPKGDHYGLIAQELQEIYPDLVSENKFVDLDDRDKSFTYLSINYQELIPILIKAVQEQQAQIEALKLQVKALQK